VGHARIACGVDGLGSGVARDIPRVSVERRVGFTKGDSPVEVENQPASR